MVAAPAAAQDRLTLEEAIALAEKNRDITLKIALERDVRLVAFEDGRIEFEPAQGAQPGLAAEIGRKLTAWTNRRWVVAVSSGAGEATIRERQEEERASKLRGVAAHPHVQKVLEKFPGAEIVGVRSTAPAAEPDAAPPPEEEE